MSIQCLYISTDSDRQVSINSEIMLSRRKLKKFCHKGPLLPILPAYTSHEITYEYTQSCRENAVPTTRTLAQSSTSHEAKWQSFSLWLTHFNFHNITDRSQQVNDGMRY